MRTRTSLVALLFVLAPRANAQAPSPSSWAGAIQATGAVPNLPAPATFMTCPGGTGAVPDSIAITGGHVWDKIYALSEKLRGSRPLWLDLTLPKAGGDTLRARFVGFECSWDQGVTGVV